MYTHTCVKLRARTHTYLDVVEMFLFRPSFICFRYSMFTIRTYSQTRSENGHRLASRTGAAEQGGRRRATKLMMSMLMMLTTVLATCGCSCKSVWRALAYGHTCAIGQSHACSGNCIVLKWNFPKINAYETIRILLRYRLLLRITHLSKGNLQHPNSVSRKYIFFREQLKKEADVGCSQLEI